MMATNRVTALMEFDLHFYVILQSSYQYFIVYYSDSCIICCPNFFVGPKSSVVELMLLGYMRRNSLSRFGK